MSWQIPGHHNKVSVAQKGRELSEQKGQHEKENTLKKKMRETPQKGRENILL